MRLAALTSPPRKRSPKLPLLRRHYSAERQLQNPPSPVNGNRRIAAPCKFSAVQTLSKPNRLATQRK